MRNDHADDIDHTQRIIVDFFFLSLAIKRDTNEGL